MVGNPQMNGVAERFGQTLLHKLHPILLSSGLNKSFWPEIMATFNYLILRSPVVKLNTILFEAFYHRQPILSHLRTIGSIAYALKRIQKKLINKSEKCILLNYEEESIFRLYNLIKKKVIRANDVYFVERRPQVINADEDIETHERPNKRQRLSVPASAVEETQIGEQRPAIEDVASVEPEPNRRAPPISDDIAPVESSPNSTPRPNFPWPAGRHAPTPGPSRASVLSVGTLSVIRPPPPQSPSAAGAAAINNVRENSELRAIQKVLLDYPDLTIPDLRNLSPDPLAGAFAAFALLADHANKPDIFEPKTYE